MHYQRRFQYQLVGKMLLVNLLFVCASALAVPRPQALFYSEDQHDLEQHFEEFIATHGKQYAHEEEKQTRFEIFKQNVAIINKKNSNPEETAVFVVNQFADLTLEEFQATHLGLVVDPNRPPVDYEQVTHVGVPEEFDWRNQKTVTRVKDQGRCGSCWAFSAIGAVEGAYAIKHKELKEFSEQQLVSCDFKDWRCAGGEMQTGIQYIIEAGGIEGEADYPYTAKNGTCTFDKSKIRAKVTKMLAYNLTNAEDAKEILVKNGPIAIALDGTDLEFYGGGIKDYCTGDKIDHGVLLVGYGKEGDTNFWIIKNSWGPDFGEKGYFRVAYKKGYNPCGMYNGYAAGAEMA